MTDKYLQQYKSNINFDLQHAFDKLKNGNELDFEYLIEASAVYSSNIEGNSMDLNSFMNSKISGAMPKPKEHIEIVDLINAYKFAQINDLTEENFLKTHQISSAHFLIVSKQGIYRDGPVGVFGSQGLIYMAIEAKKVAEAMKELFTKISELLAKDLTIEEVFYYTSFIHLRLAHIHPFSDGNGRAARLLEKWFIAQKLGDRAWAIQSEKYYKENIKDYYANINLGVNYYEVDYDKALPFLLLLLASLK